MNSRLHIGWQSKEFKLALHEGSEVCYVISLGMSSLEEAEISNVEEAKNMQSRRSGK